MLLLIQEGKKEREHIQSRIGDIESSLSTPRGQQAPILQTIREEILKLETTIKEMKVRKFKRDMEDYQRGHVYRWNQPRFSRDRHVYRQSDRQPRPRQPRVSFNLTSSEDEGRSMESESDHFLEDDWPRLQSNHRGLRRHAGAAEVEERPRPPTLRSLPRKKYPR